jgi:iron complex outermembrane recepter protein
VATDFRFIFTTCSVAILAVYSGGSRAAAGPDSAADNPGEQLAEIVVTAQKRSENLQDVPIAVSVVNDATLQHMGVSDIADLSIAVPGLYATNSAGRLTLNLRGIGSNSLGPGVESPIALYIDGVYYGDESASLLSLNNVSQIETLKGPQGTLFGRNATGGLLQITTKEPTQTPAGSISVTEANYQTSILSAYVSGGIAPDVAADFAMYAKHQGDGWGTDLTTGGQTYDVKHDVSVRSKWVFTPQADTKLTLIGDYENVADRMVQFVVRGGTLTPFDPGVVQPDLGYDSRAGDEPEHTIKAGGTSLRVDQNFGDWQFASISAWRKSDVVIGGDIDTFAANLESFIGSTFDEQLTQEFQVNSHFTDALRWTAGLFGFYDKTGYDPYTVALPVAGFTIYYPFAKLKGTSEAAYLQATYDLPDRTSITLGGRFTHEVHTEYGSYSQDYPTGANPATGAVVIYPGESITADKFTYRASIAHHFSDQAMAYASINTGFKAGGFNVSTLGSPGYEPETLTAYEVGAKTDLFNDRVRFNSALFYYMYKDIQVIQYQDISVTTVNGARARSYGLDADITALLVNGLTLTGGIVADRPKFDSFPGCGIGAPGGGVPLSAGNCGGNQITGAPKIDLNVALDYKFDLTRDSVLDFAANAYYNGGYYTDNANYIHQDRFAKVGLFASWELRDAFSISAYGNNIFNKRTLTYGDSQGNGVQLVEFMPPRTYGVTFGYRF